MRLRGSKKYISGVKNPLFSILYFEYEINYALLLICNLITKKFTGMFMYRLNLTYNFSPLK